MDCTVCGEDVWACKCPDLNDRMRKASDSEYVAMRWCQVCDSYYARCRCPEPDWVCRVGGRFMELPASLLATLANPPGGMN